MKPEGYNDNNNEQQDSLNQSVLMQDVRGELNETKSVTEVMREQYSLRQFEAKERLSEINNALESFQDSFGPNNMMPVPDVEKLNSEKKALEKEIANLTNLLKKEYHEKN